MLDPTPTRAFPARSGIGKLARRLLIGAAAVTVLCGLRYEIFGANGLLAMHRKQQEYRQELARLQQLESENRSLHRDIQSLKNGKSAIERIAREELHLTRPGEVVYTYREEKH